ncbi:erythromycin esterase family protein [Streptomyces composti]|uniref:erythromycin esterase family protein n=1 Tax=Streptomyces composti TaxID=2720025 RepID=UPI001F1059B6|nr:erythromycin esterase family protein [Streptomyces composti]
MAPSPTRRFTLAARLLIAALVWLVVVPGTVAMSPAGGDSGPPDRPAAGDPLPGLEHIARPLRSTDPTSPAGDLRPLVRAVGDAVVVGVGEAAHGSRDFVTFRDRVFRHLVEEKGFRAFALEANWSAGVRLDEYLRTGRGDPVRIMSEEFQNAHALLHSQDYLDTIRWMRRYNSAHPGDPVRFVGTDNGYAGPELYDRVEEHVRRAHPELLPQVTELYRGLRPTVSMHEWVRTAMAAPLGERRERAERTGKVLELLRARGSAGTARGSTGADDDHVWAVQHATAVDQVARLYAFDFADPEVAPQAMAYRDRVMAENTLWWHRRTGQKVVAGGHNSHLYLTSSTPDLPLPQGQVLRERLGEGYVMVAASFDRGTVHATEKNLQNPTDEDIRRFEVEPAAPGTVEHMLDRVSHADWYADLRTAPPPARAWLNTALPKREIGTDYPPDGDQVALLRMADLVVHLHEIRPSRRLDRVPAQARTPASGGAAGTDPLPALRAAARPLRTVEPEGPFTDLRPLGEALGDARLVGVGQASHGGHEFQAFQHRALRYLVAEKGFRSLVLEAPWSTGVRLDDYLRTGRGDPLRIMSDELHSGYLFMHTREILGLIRWMRQYNIAHPGDPLRFAGNDSSYAGPQLYDRVEEHVRRAHPDLLPRVRELYRGLRPTLPALEYMIGYLGEPLDVRREKAERTAEVLELLRERTPKERTEQDHLWAVQHATAVDQVARQYAFDYDDPDEARRAMAYRDTMMADNTLWWLEQTGDRTVLAASNGHVYLEGYTPDYPVIQGGLLRRALGDDYRVVGAAFGRGSFLAADPSVADPSDTDVKRFSSGPIAPGSVEETLDRVGHPHWFVDLRTAPAAARAWLGVTRPKREIGTHWPRPPDQVNVLRSADVLVYVHQTRPIELLPRV